MKALISYEIAKEFSQSTGIRSIPLLPYKRLDTPVQCHADMLFCILDNIIFCYEEYVKELDIVDELTKDGYEVRFVSSVCGNKYPDDIALNVLVMGKTIFCNSQHTAAEILEYADENGFKIVDVKQGYAACSTIALDENSAITADKGVYEAIISVGKECLLIDSGDIVLNGYDYGFCGGASGIWGNTVCFFGDVSTLKSSKEICDLLKRKKFKEFSILSGRVYDFGGFKLLK